MTGIVLVLFLFLCAPWPHVAAAQIRYRTEIVGVDAPDLLRVLREASQLVAYEDRPPPGEAALARRAAADLERLDAVMRSEGYYDAVLSHTLDTTADPARVIVSIEPGSRYVLTEVHLVDPQGGQPRLLQGHAPSTFGLAIGGPARAAPIVDAEEKIVRVLREQGFPLAAVPERRVVIDQATKTMAVTYTVDTGPLAAFGATMVTGLDRLMRDHVDRRLQWREGALYDIRLIENTRRKLVNTGLFATVRITPGSAVGPDGRIPINIDITERPPRSIGAGVNYDSGTGAAARAFWEHRNLFGEAEALRLRGELGQRRQAASTTFRKPDIFRVDQDLLADITAENESFEAYDRTRVRAFSGLEWAIDDTLTVGAGGEIERTRIDENVRTRTYTLVGTPMFVRRDATDNLLDPRTGSRQTLTVTPYLGALGSDFTFVSSRLSASFYHPLDDDRRFVLAAFGAVGSIVGESRDTLPKDQRLYIGGGGSIRGYGYQLVGPLDQFGDPIGGRSSIELGVELRIQITDTIGIVPFFEGGDVYESSLPKLSTDLFYGAGLGLRYHTPIGPVRLDVAFPLDRRPEDDAFQIYISLGQAF